MVFALLHDVVVVALLYNVAVVGLLFNVVVVAWSKLSQLMVQPLSQTDMGGKLREVLQVGQV